MKKSGAFLCITLAALFCLGGLTACKSAGAVTPSQSIMTTCPACGGALTTVPAKDVAYTRAICPVCGEETGLYPSADKQLYLGTYASVQVCDECMATIATCAACRKSVGMN